MLAREHTALLALALKALLARPQKVHLHLMPLLHPQKVLSPLALTLALMVAKAVAWGMEKEKVMAIAVLMALMAALAAKVVTAAAAMVAAVILAVMAAGVAAVAMVETAVTAAAGVEMAETAAETAVVMVGEEMAEAVTVEVVTVEAAAAKSAAASLNHVKLKVVK